jgi:hypothetical protein
MDPRVHGVKRPDWPAEKRRFPTYVTDGPFLFRNHTGVLLMLWSSTGTKGYAMGIARSESANVTGPLVAGENPVVGRGWGTRDDLPRVRRAALRDAPQAQQLADGETGVP